MHCYNGDCSYTLGYVLNKQPEINQTTLLPKHSLAICIT